MSTRSPPRIQISRVIAMTDIEYLRAHCPATIPLALREVVLANVVVGNMTTGRAADLLGLLGARYRSDGVAQQPGRGT